jgi:putative transposase
VRAPRANAIVERFLGSVRRECLDHLLILSERHLLRVLSTYCRYFNASRPHQGIGQAIPEPAVGRDMVAASSAPICVIPVLGGLHHDYRRVA